MTDAERKEQVAKQCDVVFRKATRLAETYREWASEFRRCGPSNSFIEHAIGDSSARWIEDLRTEVEDDDEEIESLRLVMAKSRILWPQE